MSEVQSPIPVGPAKTHEEAASYGLGFKAGLDAMAHALQASVYSGTLKLVHKRLADAQEFRTLDEFARIAAADDALTPVQLKPGTYIQLSYVRADPAPNGTFIGVFMTRFDTLQAHVDALRTGGPLPPEEACECSCEVEQSCREGVA